MIDDDVLSLQKIFCIFILLISERSAVGGVCVVRITLVVFVKVESSTYGEVLYGYDIPRPIGLRNMGLKSA